MSQAGSRKRPAPGALPISQQLQQASLEPNLVSSQLGTDPYLQWNQAPSIPPAPSYPDPSGNYIYANPQQQASSNQLTRRSMGQNVVQRAPYANGNPEPWSPLVESFPQQHNEGAHQDDGDSLDQKAAAAQRGAQARRKQIPPFVQKLSSFLDPSRNGELSHLIRWSENGDSFIVVDEDEFAKTLIPELFKHNNYASFVRQLNMYGFHKKVGLSDNSMRASERKNKSPSEYYNPYFKRGKPNLLWLIQKPKGTQGKGGKGRLKQDDNNMDDDVEEVYDVDQPQHVGPPAVENHSGLRQGRQPLLIGDINAPNAPPPQDLASVQQELQTVRRQQQLIANLLQRVRRDHEQLYNQAVNFQKLHDRHESSINAILSFLATVYSRNLEDKGAQSFGGMFGAIPQNNSGQGNVVDVGDYGERAMPNAQSQANYRRQLLLDAPPAKNQSSTQGNSPAASVESPDYNSRTHNYGTRSQGAAHSPAVQEVFDNTSNRSSQSPQLKANKGETPAATSNDSKLPEADILSMINNTNASSPFLNKTTQQMEFPEGLLSHLQSPEGNSPLTQNQRNDVFRLMSSAQGNSPASNENALTSPSPTMPNLAQLQRSQEQINALSSALKQQDDKVNQLSSVLAPLSPSGSIPGIADNMQHGDPGVNDMLDLDQYIYSDNYFNDSTNDFDFPLSGGQNGGGGDLDDANGNYDFNPSNLNGNNDGLPDFTFHNENGDGFGGGGLGFDGTEDVDDGNRVVETVDSSEATSPANTVVDGGGGEAAEEGQSPGKRRRVGR